VPPKAGGADRTADDVLGWNTRQSGEVVVDLDDGPGVRIDDEDGIRVLPE
jgi:hypothetical protein